MSPPSMPRRTLPNPNQFPLHINARAMNREAFKIPLCLVWEIMENYLSLVSKIYTLKLYSFVLMPNHFHLILRPTEDNLGLAMNYFMRETSKQIGLLSGRINHVYGGRCHKTMITNETHFSIAYKYVYRNPVKAGLCKNVEDYPYSTLSFLTGKTRCVVPLELDTRLFRPEFSLKTIEWLNMKPASHHEEGVRLAIRRRVFEFPKDKNSKKLSELENGTY
jgi:putative transposase